MFDKVYAFTYLRLNLPFISRREKLGAPGELFLYDPASGCINGVNWEVVHLQETPFPFDWTRTGKRVYPTLHIHSDLARHCRLHERKCHLNLFYPPRPVTLYSPQHRSESQPCIAIHLYYWTKISSRLGLIEKNTIYLIHLSARIVWLT